MFRAPLTSTSRQPSSGTAIPAALIDCVQGDFQLDALGADVVVLCVYDNEQLPRTELCDLHRKEKQESNSGAL